MFLQPEEEMDFIPIIPLNESEGDGGGGGSAMLRVNVPKQQPGCDKRT